jgi:hypothetical protein
VYQRRHEQRQLVSGKSGDGAWVIDWKASKEAWIEQAQAVWVPSLLGDTRFADAKKAVKRFTQAVATWRKKKATDFTFREVINIGNELGAAHALLGRLKPTDTLKYEPRLGTTKQTIDFLACSADGGRGWIDVKTVAPKWQDDEDSWKRFMEIAGEFEGARLVVDRQFGGAGISGQLIKARWSFIARTVQLERKVALIPPDQAGKVWLLLCGDRFDWHLDDLEDFADFYRTGYFRPDDWASNAMARYMKEREQAFSRTLSGFHYLGRRDDEVQIDLHLDVRGPNLYGP